MQRSGTSSIDAPPTCGRGLAEHAAIPAALGAVVAALARNLEVHQTTLDLDDANSRREHQAYVELAAEHRITADRLMKSARQMASYRDLPMGAHDTRALSDARVVEAFRSYVEAEEALLELLQEAVDRDRKMLAGMRSQGAGGGE